MGKKRIVMEMSPTNEQRKVWKEEMHDTSKSFEERIKRWKEVGGKVEDEDKEWIHREQHGKIRGVHRLGFKPICKKRSFW